MSDYNKCLRERKIVFGNDFDTRAEINLLFGLKKGAGTMQGGASLEPVNREGIIWWPNDPSANNTWVNAKEEYGTLDDARGYREVLMISEENRDPKANARHLEEVVGNVRSQTRYVFWHEAAGNARWYKFYGIYRFMVEKSKSEGKCWFERVETGVDL